MTSPSRATASIGGDRRRLEQERGVAPSPAVDRGDRLGGRLRVADRAAGDGVGIDPERAARGRRRGASRRGRAAPRRRPAGRPRTRRGGRVRMAPPARVQSPNRPAPPAASAGGLEGRRRARPRRRPARPRTARRRRSSRSAAPSSPIAAHEAVGRQDGQRLAGRLQEERQQVVERRVLLARARHPPLVAVAQRRLVAMVAVGDGDRPAAAAAMSAAASVRRVGPSPSAGDGPQAMADAVVVDDVDVRRAAPRRSARRPPVVAARRRRRGRRPGSCSRRSRGAACSGPPSGRPASARAAARRDPGPNGSSRSRAKNPRWVRSTSVPGHPVGLLVDVDRRVRVLAQRAVGAPGREGPGRAPVAVVGLVAGLLGRQVEAHDVGRVAARRARARSLGAMTSYGGRTTRPRSPTTDGSKRRARNGRMSGTDPRRGRGDGRARPAAHGTRAIVR